LIDDKREFYKDEVILVIEKDDIEQFSFKEERDTTQYYGKITTGPEYEQPEEISGLEEFISKEEYTTPIIIENELDLVNQYIYAGYPFEFTRRNPYDGTKTSDYKYDNNNMLMVMFRNGGFIQETTEGFETITGIDDITTPINISITPQRNYRQNWAWWAGVGFDKVPNGVLLYGVSTITTDLESKKTTEVYPVRENPVNIPISELEESLFSGDIHSFSAPATFEIFKLLRANPGKAIKYWNNLINDYSYGWIEEVSTEPVNHPTNYRIKVAKFVVGGDTFRITDDGAFRITSDGSLRITS